mgnify:CR=1 FL=1
MSIASVLKRWELVHSDIDASAESKDPNYYVIKPLSMDTHNRLYVSSNCTRTMVIYIEFNDKKAIDNYTLPQLKGISLHVSSEKIINGKEYLKIVKDNECPEEMFVSFSISLLEEAEGCNTDLEMMIGVATVMKQYSNLFTKTVSSLGKEKEQGLYCELLYLEELIADNDDKIISNWTGPDKNKHDFCLTTINLQKSNRRQIMNR